MDQVLRLLNQLRRDKIQLKSDLDYFKESFQALDSGVVRHLHMRSAGRPSMRLQQAMRTTKRHSARTRNAAWRDG